MKKSDLSEILKVLTNAKQPHLIKAMNEMLVDAKAPTEKIKGSVYGGLSLRDIKHISKTTKGELDVFIEDEGKFHSVMGAMVKDDYLIIRKSKAPLKIKF